ncbi:class I SAM-dependent methyltransferase [Spiractinospora alimapuensis]|uniref:class I SAM-dependent methyltransferase n=1 Tax=Spiractinospora alimapuensis TaxID=2820884 RepID=UPI001F472898|nr:class I SAM-dependent methyltransferase [Spiractinospora alimapuensis]QVQ51222.1 class I SAM-dependent methyltransferase [Spiractinospora alimapuensis]
MSSMRTTTSLRRLVSATLRRIDDRSPATRRGPRRKRRGPDDEDLGTEIAELREQLDALRAQMHYMELLFGPTGGRGDRRPSRKAIATLEGQISAVTGTEDPHIAVVQAYGSLVEAEMRGVGRIAGGSMNVLGKLVTTPMLEPPNGEVLEIGSLYGLFSCCFARELVRYGVDYHLTLVDPLASVQIQPGRRNGVDRSGSPVSEEVLRANLSLAGVPAERARLHKGYSTDPEVRSAVGDREYGVVIIDGDHSAEGVREDLHWVMDLVTEGTVVVLDDYGDKKWPGVQEATDEFLRTSDRFDFLGAVATSAFLRARA